jgi:hypothetical protein
MTGCAAHHDDTLRLHEELGHARGQAEWERARAAEAERRASLVEARMSRLEQTWREASITRSIEESRLVDRVEHLVDVTEQLMDERAAEVMTSFPATASSAAPASAALAPHEGSTFDRAVARGVALTPAQHEQMRELAEILLAPSGSARVLTRDQERAIRLLLRSDRKLDTRNPWLGQTY